MDHVAAQHQSWVLFYIKMQSMEVLAQPPTKELGRKKQAGAIRDGTWTVQEGFSMLSDPVIAEKQVQLQRWVLVGLYASESGLYVSISCVATEQL